MTWLDLLGILRGEVEDTVEPYAWSNNTLLGYLAEGQDKFCEYTGFLRDATMTIELVTGVASYALPAIIIELLEVRNSSNQLLRRAPVEEVWTPTTVNGQPSAWRTDFNSGEVTFDCPAEIGLNEVHFPIKVWRYGVAPSVATINTTAPNIPGRFHRACVEWAAYKVLNWHYAETQDPIKARDHRVIFDGYVSDGSDMFRRSHGIDAAIVPNPAYRT